MLSMVIPAGESGASMTDTDLMVRVKGGDESAFRLIVEKYQRRVVNVAYRLLGNRDDAEEVAQETFLKAYMSAKSYTPKAELFTYLYTIATRLALNRLRKERRFRWLSLDASDENEGEMAPEPISNPSDRPDLSLEQAERDALVRRAMDALPAAQKAVLVFSRYEGLSYKEIADVMETSVSAVESKLHRAKQTLKKKLSTYLENF